ncbi:glyoxalase bleomycin resistance protein dioxygenase [Viridothelium virens]|uniref:Glyoxalase bleomycin resistance protein dioxygenase n=1 Tax=Viridothelium virens TaxID=1048519 RepID=A0A6A6HIU1_VIRVR|nr:glyoxalase bleomycin resistance protein dioxygenase [Viridothelium virens]
MSSSSFNFNATNGKVTSPIKLAHIVLYTNQLDKMEKFYVDFLGGHVAHKAPHQMSFITYDDEHHRIALIEAPSLKRKDHHACGLHHIAFTFPTPQALLLAYRQRLVQYSIKPWWCVNHGPTVSLYYQDPDGNSIETQVDCFENNEDATAFMEGEKFRINPIGVDFDPEDMIKKLEADANWDGWRKREDIGERGIDSVLMPA